MNPITRYRWTRCDRIMRTQYGRTCANPNDHAPRFHAEEHIHLLVVLALIAGVIIGLLTANVWWQPGTGYVIVP